MSLSTLSICISIAVAFAAIISPIAVTILNNRYQLKLKRIELEQQHFEQTIMRKREIIENYLRTCGAFLSFPSNSTNTAYGEYYFKALLYVPENLRLKMISVHQNIKSQHYADASEVLEGIIPQLEQLLQK